MARFNAKEKEKIMELRAQFPKRINVSIRSAEESGFWSCSKWFSGMCCSRWHFLRIDWDDQWLPLRLFWDFFILPYMPIYLPPVSRDG